MIIDQTNHYYTTINLEKEIPSKWNLKHSKGKPT